jgi:hypothetical protein
MPLAKRYSFVNETVRNHPVIVATTAATGGVLLGAFVVFQLFAAPQPPRADGTAQAAVEAKAAPTPVKAQAETTGSAPAGESDASKVASSECDQQTWPYLSRACIEETRAKKGGPRVVSTDKLDKPTVAAIETPPPQAKDDVALAAPAPWAPAASTPTPPVVAPAVATVGTPKQLPEAAPEAPAGVAAVTPPEPPAATPPAPAAATPEIARTNSTPASHASASAVKEAAVESKAQSRSAKKAKRKPKPERALAERDANSDDDEVSAASVERESRAARRVDRRRIVERWIERDYDVAADDGGGRRRVIVIRRGGGPFEGLFGMGRREYEDD